MELTKNALLSAYNKKGIVEFARDLISLRWKLYGSKGTVGELAKAGIEATDIATIVGEPILGHRVVTLSREVHAGILSRDIQEDIDEVDKLGIPRFGLVYVDIYPLEKETQADGATLESVLELMDIGGPTMLSSASKGQRIVVCDQRDLGFIIDHLKSGQSITLEFTEALAAKADFVVSRYRALTANFRGQGEYFTFHGVRSRVCKYGENAYQTPAAFYSAQSSDSLALDRFELVTGTPPSYNNLCDLDRLVMTMTHASAALDILPSPVPIALVVKHGNCCGAAFGWNPADALKRMIEGDEIAIMGGVVMTNFPLDEHLAEILLSYHMKDARRLIDGIVAPNFTEDAVDLLRRKKDKCRLLKNSKLAKLERQDVADDLRFRHVRGGVLVQPNYSFIFSPFDKRIEVHGGRNTDIEPSLSFAWAIGSTSNSNTITLVKDGFLIGNGTGQQDRVGAAKLAIDRARRNGHDPEGAVAYSDSFFPFPDGPQVLIDAGIIAILTSSGSVRDKETIELCEEKEISLYMIPDEIGRGFFGH